MQSPILKRLLFAVLFCSFAAGAAAEAWVTIRIHAPPVRGILTQDSVWNQVPGHVWVVDGDRSFSVQVTRNGYSRPFRVRASEPLFLAGPPAEDGGERKPFLLTTLPEDVTEAVISLLPGEVDEAGLMKFQLLDFSKDEVPPGSHVFANRLENPMELTVADQTHFLEPNQDVILELEAVRTRIFIQEIDGARGRRYTGAVHGPREVGTRHMIHSHPQSARRIELRTFYGINPADLPEEEPEDAPNQEAEDHEEGVEPVSD